MGMMSDRDIEIRNNIAENIHLEEGEIKAKIEELIHIRFEGNNLQELRDLCELIGSDLETVLKNFYDDECHHVDCEIYMCTWIDDTSNEDRLCCRHYDEARNYTNVERCNECLEMEEDWRIQDEIAERRGN